MEKLPRSQNSRDPYLRKDLEAELHISRGKVATGGALELPASPVRPLTQVPQLLPIATAQRGMWMGEKIGPADAVYKLAEYVDIRGHIDAAVFLRATSILTQEAESTRVQIIETADGPRQLVAEAYMGELPVVDFSSHADAEQRALRWMNDELRRPADLADDALWFSALIKVEDERFFWYHRCHHITIDGFGGGLIARRMAEIYNALLSGEEPGESPFLPLVTQLEQEKLYRESARFERDRDYWKQQLSGLPDAISLSRRNAQRSGGLRRSGITLSLEHSAKIRDIAQQYGGSVPQLLIAMLAVYTYRMTGQQDLVFGMPVTARANRTLRSIPAMMANAVAIRLAMADDASLVDLLGQTAKTVRNALRHQQYRYEELRRDLGLLAQGQQISWMGVNIEPFDYDLGFGGHECSAHNLSNGTVEDMTVFVFDRGAKQGMNVVIDANPALYSQRELDEHRDRLARLIEAMIAAPEGAIGDFDLLSEQERHLQLQAWNDTKQPLPDSHLPALFDKSVAAFPSHAAVSDAGQTLSYSAFGQQVNQLARALNVLGVGPGKLVAVSLPRTAAMPMTLLAIMKCGAAYLPLDPETPAERLAMILDDAKPSLLLSSVETAEKLPDCEIQTLLWEELNLNAFSGDDVPLADIGANSPAYIIYTSGSTGRPKGVVIGHRSLMNFLLAMQDALALQPEQRMLALTTVSFDIAVLEMFLPLLAGAQVHVATRDIARDPAALAALVNEQAITHIQATPSHWQALLEDNAEAFTGVQPLVGGEALPMELARKMRKLGAPIINLYGPTETTIWSTMMTLDKLEGGTPAIGRPIWNTQVYVLGDDLQLLPNGAAGELYIGGEGLALGYHKRPDLTAERFIANPHGEGLLYKTGDLARWRDDGALEYLGRNDFQIKIRGFRVETEEIESQLIRCRGVRRAAVVLRNDPAGVPKLVAFLLGEEGFDAQHTALEAATLRQQIERSLPEYMLPSHYQVLDDFPLNVNGKLDRKALPEPQWQLVSEYTAPRNALETQLAELWCEIFKLPRIGIHDSFFDLGADSITAARMVSRLRDVVGKDVPLAAIFEATTIAELAEQLERGDQIDPLAGVQALNPLAARGEGDALFCIHPVLGLSWGFAGLNQYLPDGTALFGIQSRGLSGGQELPASIEEIAADYIALMRDRQPQGPYRILGWSMGGVIAQEMARQLRELDESVSFLGALDSYPFVSQQRDDKAGQVRSILEFLDIAVEGELPDTMEELSELLCREYDVLNLEFVKQLQGKQSALIDDVSAVISNNLQLLQNFQPRPVDVELHFFQAVQTATSQELHHRPDAWQDAVAGLNIYPVECHHQQMLDAEPLAVIGPFVARALAG